MISPFSPRPTIEPLEARIAPALLVNGANLLGAGSPSTGEMSLGGDAVTLVKVISGQAIVWFQDGEISSISIGHNTNLEITGDIYGAIVGNLMPSGRLSDSDNNAANGEDGAVLLPNNLAGLKTLALSSQDGDVPAVVTGGSVANVNVNGKLGGIYAGDGVFHTSSNLVAGGVVALPVGFDFNPVELNTQSVFNITLGNSPAIQPGASVHTVTVQTAKEMQIIAGSGDPDRVDNLAAGSSGGSIQNIKINSALIAGLSGGTTPSYELIAGDGEAGKTGGAGGSIINIFEKASNGTVNIQAGRGGTGNLGIGGAGGSVRALDLQSDGSDYVVRAGDGGFGVSGGAGGSATNNNLANRTPANSLLVAGDFLGNLNDADLSNDVQDGLEDLLVVDSSSGSMVLLQNLNDGASFGKVVQYVNDDLEEVVAITGLGTTPVDAFATDWDGDGDADIVVAYKSSNNLGVFLNDGAGGFYTLDENDEFAVNGFSASLSFSPSAMSPTSSSSTSTSIAVLSTEAGKTTAYYVAKSDAEAVELFGSGTPLKRLANDIAVAKGADGTEYLYVGSQDGSLLQLEPLFDPEGPAFEIIDTLQKVTGGVSNLDASGDGGQLLAFSATGKKIALFDVSSSGALLPQVAPELTGTGRPLVAHFAPNGSGDDSIVVLSSVNAGARLDLFNAVTPDADPLTPDSGFTLAKSFAAQPGLKNFVVVESDGQAGFAAVAGSLSQFYFSTNLADLTKYELPFIGKKVAVSAGRGGDALDLGSVIGKAGSGGGINGINVEASEIRLTSGDGG
ncbi:MAG TPA: VCBS repeat-containing protein, partial [Chthoniobacteraceae bacterium]